MADLPKDVSDVEKIDPTRRVDPGPSPTETPGKEDFKSYMQEGSSQAQAGTNVENKPSPMEIAGQKPVASSTPPTVESIQNQMQSVSGSLGDVKNQLHTKGLKLKQSQKYLLRKKLQSANEHIRSAAQKTGSDPGPPLNVRNSKNPIMRFLHMVSDGQYQLNSAAEQVQKLNTSGHSMNPGDLLLVQVKLQKAQQELDYTSVLLGKSIDMLKTMFNIQI